MISCCFHKLAGKPELIEYFKKCLFQINAQGFIGFTYQPLLKALRIFPDTKTIHGYN